MRNSPIALDSQRGVDLGQCPTMPTTKFIKNKKGQKVSVVLDIREYEKLIEDAEELEAIRAYDSAKEAGGTPIPYEQVLRRIEESRK